MFEPGEAELLELRYRVKHELRRRIRAVRAKLPAEARAKRSSAIARRVTDLTQWADAQCIAAYVAMRGEVNPTPLVTRAWADGKRVVLPRLEPGDTMMTMRRWEPGQELEDSGMGFRQPSAEALEEGSIDLVLVPAMAADPRGYRIGWGGGFYDRLLPTLPDATWVAIIYDFQVVPEVGQTPNDVAVHIVISDGPTYHVAPEGA